MPKPEYAPPAAPIYCHDYITSRKIAALPPAGECLFNRMLLAQWSGGALPDDIHEVMGFTGYRREFPAVWDQVRALFEVTPDGLLNARMEQVREQFAGVSRKRADAANARWGKTRGDANPDAKADAKADAKGHANSDAKGMPSSSSSSSSSVSDSEPPAPLAPAPKGGAPAPRRSKKERPGVSPDCRKVLDFIAWFKYGEAGGPPLNAPGFIPDRLKQGYTVLDCMLAYWRALRRWEGGHNQTSPFRKEHFGVLLDEARTDLAKGWENRDGSRNRGYDDLHDALKAKGITDEQLTNALALRDWNRQGQLISFVHFAEHGDWPQEGQT